MTSSELKRKALELGFLNCGISQAGFLEAEASRLETWLKNSSHGQMAYMKNHFDKRLDPRLLVEGAKSVISLSYNYFNPVKQTDPLAPKVSSYAYGEDYHLVIKTKLGELSEWIADQVGGVAMRAFVDSAPVLEKAWAARSGLGWQAKNTNIINKKAGSFFFLAEIICDLDLEADGPERDHCGTCTRCIDACPTDALTSAYVLDASKCISYLTIELKNEIPGEFAGKMENWVFGCDICQDVCPWNRFSVIHSEPAFNAPERLLDLSKEEWYDITEEMFKNLFGRSAIKRSKFTGLQKNLRFLSSSGPGSGG